MSIKKGLLFSTVWQFLTLFLLILSLGSRAETVSCLHLYGEKPVGIVFHKKDHQTLTKNVQELLHYYKAAKIEGDPQITFLERLGFRFDDKNFAVPSPRRILIELDRLIAEIQKRENLTAFQVYRPVRSFVNEKGEVLWLKTDQIVPQGFLPKYVSLDEKEFYALKKQGLFPLSDIQSEGWSISNVSLFLHDLGHFGAYIRNPKLMALDRKITEVEGGIQGDFGEYLSETLAWVNPHRRVELASHLQKFGLLLTSDFVTKNVVLEQLRNMENTQIDLLLKELFKNKFRWYVFLGGTNSDVVDLRNTHERRHSLNVELTGLNYLFSVMKKVDLDSLTIDDTLKKNRYLNRNVLLDSIASHLTQLILMLDYPVEEFYRDLLKSEHRSPHFSHLLLHSGSHFYPEHLIPLKYKK